MVFFIPEQHEYRLNVQQLESVVDYHMKYSFGIDSYKRTPVDDNFTFMASGIGEIDDAVIENVMVKHYGFEILKD